MAATASTRGAALAARCPATTNFIQSYSAQPRRPTPYKTHPAWGVAGPRESVLFTRSDLRDEEAGRVMDFTQRLLFKTTNESYYALRVPLLRAGFKRLPRDSIQQCNIIWRRPFCLTPATDEELDSSGMLSQSGEVRPLRRGQRTNHFPASYIHLGSKDGLWKCLEAMRMDFGEAFHVTPRTWVLPEEHDSLLQYVQSDDPNSQALIVKPARGSCGRDIFVCRSYSDERLQRLLSYATAPAPQPLPDVPRVRQRQRRWVVQEYLDPPMLISGRKCDIRLYVAVTSIDPLVVYVYKEGLVRFASEPYSNGESATRFADLTNSSVARKRDALLRKAPVEGDMEADPAAAVSLEPAPAPPQLPRPHRPWQVRSREVGDAPSSEDDPSWPRFKWTLSELRQNIMDEHGDAHWEEVWEGISSIVRRTLIAAQKPISAHMEKHPAGPMYRERSFEHFGFDIMLGDDLRPWLIEVNCLPSLESSSAMDWSVKCGSVTDLLNMLQIQPFEREEEDMRLRAMVDEARAARKEAERDLEQRERTAQDAAQDAGEPGPELPVLREKVAQDAGEPGPELPVLREKVAQLRQAEDEALAKFRTACQGAVAREEPVQRTPEGEADTTADRLEAELTHRGGYQRIFPTAASVASDGAFFSGSASDSRNRALWNSMQLA